MAKLTLTDVIVNHENLFNSYKNHPIPSDLSIGVVIATCRPNLIKNTIIRLVEQTIKVDKVVIITHGYNTDELLKLEALVLENKLDVTFINDIRYDAPVGYRLNAGVKKIDTEVVLIMDDDDVYFKDYIKSKVKALLFSKASLCGNKSVIAKDVSTGVIGFYYEDFSSERRLCMSGTLCFWRKDYLTVGGMSLLKSGSARALQFKLTQNGFKIFETDMFNFLLIRGDGEQRLSPLTTEFVNKYIVEKIVYNIDEE